MRDGTGMKKIDSSILNRVYFKSVQKSRPAALESPPCQYIIVGVTKIAQAEIGDVLKAMFVSGTPNSRFWCAVVEQAFVRFIRGSEKNG